MDGAAKNMVNFQLHQRSSAQGQTFEVNSLDDKKKKTMKMSNLAQKYSVHYFTRIKTAVRNFVLVSSHKTKTTPRR